MVRFSVLNLVWSLLTVLTASGQFEPWARPVLHTGQEIPGHEGLSVHLNVQYGERIGAGGHALISASLQGEGVTNENNDAVYWIDPLGNLEMVIREGDETPSGPFTREQAGGLSASGNIALLANHGSGSSSARSLLYGSPGGLSPVIATGQQAPGDWAEDEQIHGGQALIEGLYSLRVIASGSLAFNAHVRIDAHTESAIYTSNGGAPALAIRSNRNYPGMLPASRENGPETVFRVDGFGNELLMNEAGDLAFKAKDNYDRLGIWIWSGGRISLVALEDDSRGITGTGIYGLEILSFAGSEVALQGRRFGDGIHSANDDHIWVGWKGSLTLVAREGDPAPGSEGASAGSFSGSPRFSLSAGGTGALLDALSNGKRGVWAWNGGLSNLALVDGEVPGYPGNAWAQISEVAIGPAGLIAVRASHVGATAQRSNLWVSDRGKPLLEATLPQTLTLPDGTLRNVSVKEILNARAHIPSGGSRAHSFNARNELLIEYSSGSYGVLSFDGRLDLGSISGVVRIDEESESGTNGTSVSPSLPRTQADGDSEEGIEGVTLRLFAAEEGSPVGEPLQSTVSDVRGGYRFKNLSAGNYSIVAELLPGFAATIDSDDEAGVRTEGRIALNLEEGEDVSDLEFQQARLPGANQILGRLLEDPNSDGDASDATKGIEGIQFVIAERGMNESTRTDAEGAFAFDHLPDGNHRVAGTIDFFNDNGLRFTVDPFDESGKSTARIVTIPSETEQIFLAAFPAKIMGTVRDALDPEKGLPGALIKLLSEDGSEVENQSTQVTDQNGNFTFTVRPGSYIVEESDPSGYESTNDTNFPGNDNRIAVTVSSGEVSDDHEFVDRKSPIAIVLRRLGNDGIANLNEPQIKPPSYPLIEPMLPVADGAVLASQPVVTEGLVADGVTPLLIDFSLQDEDLEETEVLWTLDTETGGGIKGGIGQHLWGQENKQWVRATTFNSQVVLSQDAPRAFAYIEALDPSELMFELGQTEIILSFRLFAGDNFSEPLAEKRIALRRLPLVLISETGPQPWSESFIEPFRLQTHSSFIFQLGSERKIPVRLANLKTDFLLHWASTRFDVIAHGRSFLELTRQLQIASTHSPSKFRNESNHYRGLYRRIIAVGAPNNGTRFTPYLKELDNRLNQLDPNGVFISRYSGYPRSSRSSWEKLLQAEESSNHFPPWDLDPQSPFFTRPVAYDIGTRVSFIATHIKPTKSRAYQMVGLKNETLKTVFPRSSDGLVNRRSVEAAAEPARRNSTIFLGSTVSHPNPSEAFGTDFTQTTSPGLAQEVFELLNEPIDTDKFFFYLRPPRISDFDVHSISKAAFDVPNRIVVDVRRVARKVVTQARFPSLLVDVQEPRQNREFGFELPLIAAQPIEGEVFWHAEVYGPDGVSGEGVRVTPDPQQSNAAAVSVDVDVVGDVVLFASYETYQEGIAFARPILVTSQDPPGATIQGVELLPDDFTLEPGETIQPDIVTVYDDGTRITRWLDEAFIATLQSSNQDALSVMPGGRIQATGAGSATLSVEAFGFSAEATFQVPEPLSPLSYEAWKAQRFTEAELADPELTSAHTDLDQDGLTLLEEYFGGGDPRAGNVDFGPRIIEAVVDGQRRLGFVVRISKQIDPETSHVESSTNLRDWDALLNDYFDPTLESMGLLSIQESTSHVELFFEAESLAAVFFRLRVEEN